jgi:hypothetical protein
VAAYLKYKSPDAAHREALKNTKRMSDMFVAMEQLAAMKKPEQ